MTARRVTLFTVDRYGWTWQRSWWAEDPPKALGSDLAKAWGRDLATDVGVETPGRRPVSV